MIIPNKLLIRIYLHHIILMVLGGSGIILRKKELTSLKLGFMFLLNLLKV